MAIGNGLPPENPTIEVDVELEYQPIDHMYAEGIDLEESYEIPDL